MRIAVDRFLRSKICANHFEAFTKLMEEHVLPVGLTYPTEK